MPFRRISSSSGMISLPRWRLQVKYLKVRRRDVMANHVYKKIELTGSSPHGIDDAIKNAINRASKTLRNLRWFEVTEMRGHIEDGQISHYQVTVKIGFTLDDDSDVG
jgi:dodecin